MASQTIEWLAALKRARERGFIVVLTPESGGLNFVVSRRVGRGTQACNRLVSWKELEFYRAGRDALKADVLGQMCDSMDATGIDGGQTGGGE